MEKWNGHGRSFELCTQVACRHVLADDFRQSIHLSLFYPRRWSMVIGGPRSRKQIARKVRLKMEIWPKTSPPTAIAGSLVGNIRQPAVWFSPHFQLTTNHGRWRCRPTRIGIGSSFFWCLWISRLKMPAILLKIFFGESKKKQTNSGNLFWGRTERLLLKFFFVTKFVEQFVPTPERPWFHESPEVKNLRQRERKKIEKKKKKTSHRRRDNAPTGYQSPESHFMLCKRCHGCSDDRINLKLLLLKDSTKSSQFSESTDPWRYTLKRQHRFSRSFWGQPIRTRRWCYYQLGKSCGDAFTGWGCWFRFKLKVMMSENFR